MSSRQTTGRLRILRVSSDTYPEVPGGLGLHVHSLSKRQAELGHDVTVVTSDHGNRNLPTTEQRDGYTIRRYKQLTNVFGNSITPGIAKAIHNVDREYDLVHAHSHLFFSTNIVAAMDLFEETPLVITNHGVRSQTAPNWIQRLYLPTVGRWTLNAADRVFCYSETDLHRLRELGVTAPIAVISNGINCSRFRPKAGSENENRILYVGRLTEKKGVHLLIEAVASIVEEIPETTLHIVGDGPQREQLEQLVAERSLGAHVTFRGTVPNEQMPTLYNSCSVFVLPSLTEGFPRTVIEAMACGTPVVTSDLPQLRSVVTDVGRTFRAGASEELATAIRELLTDHEQRHALKTKARKKATDHYSWHKTVEKTTTECYKVVNKTHQTRLASPNKQDTV